MKVIISSGVGRLHLVETAKAVLRRVERLEFICGYVPRRWHNWWLDPLGKIIGRPNLSNRLAVRLGAGGELKECLRSNALAEGFTQALFWLAGKGLAPKAKGQALGWKLFGARSRRYLRDQDVFHVRSGAGRGGAIKEAKRLGIRVVVDHSLAHPAYMERVLKPEYVLWDKRFGLGPSDPFWRVVLEDCAQADLLLVNSDFVRRTFINEGFDPERIAVCYLGVRNDFWGLKSVYSSAGRIRLLFTGSFELRKGARILIEAMRTLAARGFQFELHVAGEASEARARMNGGNGPELPVVWHGSLLQEQLKRLLADCDLFVFPTLAEGCARSAMEAMFAGIPVITTEACGLPGNSGEHYLEVPPGNVGALAIAIERLGNDESARRKIGEAGVALAKSGDYSWDAYGDSVLRSYRRALKLTNLE